MRDARLNYIVVGAFVLAMLVALVATVAVLTGRTGNTDAYYTHLPNVSGLKYGTKVTYEGFPVGQVDEIEPLRSQGKTSFRVKLVVNHGWLIPLDSTARVAASGLLAAVAVDIKGGASDDFLAPGSEIPSGPAANIFAVMNDVAGQVTDLSQNALKPLLGTLNERIDVVGKLLEKQAPDILANLVAVTSDVHRMTGTLSEKVVNDANARRITETLDNMTVLSRGLSDSRHKVDAVLASLDKVVAGNRDTVDQSLKDLRHTLQTVARNIDSVTYNLDGTTRNLNEFSRQLRENPGVLLGGTKRGEDGPGRR